MQPAPAMLLANKKAIKSPAKHGFSQPRGRLGLTGPEPSIWSGNLTFGQVVGMNQRRKSEGWQAPYFCALTHGNPLLSGAAMTCP